jgi:hypothetical protein
MILFKINREDRCSPTGKSDDYIIADSYMDLIKFIEKEKDDEYHAVINYIENVRTEWLATTKKRHNII